MALDDEWKRELHTDVRNIKSHVIELVKQGAVHNQILAQHEKRSLMLEERVKPIEADVQFRSKLVSAFLGLGGIATTCMAIYKLYELLH